MNEANILMDSMQISPDQQQIAMSTAYKDGRMNVRDFYRGKKVFLTGGTGFLGKVLIDKMLRELDVETIYVLVREKKGKNIHSRVDELTDDPFFDSLKRQDTKFKHKIVPISGDCSIAGLGCTITDVQTLIQNVEVVIHGAATVRFDERLDKAYAINVTGTKSIINLCHQIKNLKAFLHVSTAYSNCHLSHIEEKFYDYKLNAEEVGVLLSKLTPQEIEAKTPDIIQNWPNTYSFTKALAESLVRTDCANIPVAVFRPAIILSTYKGATPGWIDNFYGPVGGTASIYAGFSRVIYIEENNSCNVVPVDKVVDGVLAATWEVGTRPPNNDVVVKNETKIYNYVSALTQNDVTWREFITINILFGKEFPLTNAKRQIDVHMFSSRNMYNLALIVYHFIPALIIDFFLLLSGNKPRLFNMYKKLNRVMESVLFFVCHEWSFQDGNVHTLYNLMSHADQNLLPMNMLDLNWKLFMKNYILGIRKYLMKENESTIEAAYARMQWISKVNDIVKYVVMFFVANFIFNVICNMMARVLFH